MTRGSENDFVLPFLRRSDLLIRQLNVGDRVHWTIKDPVSLRFFQLREEEYYVFSRLTRGATAESIVSGFGKVFSPARLSLSRLDEYLRSLLAMGLIVNRGGDGAELLAQADRLKRATWLASLGNPLVIRWRGLNPRLLLNFLYTIFQWCFSAGFVWISIALMFFAAGWMAVNHEEFVLRLPTVSAFIGAGNIVWIAAAIGVAKILHELGHALTCKHFGGECREMGVMLLVFTPCLYCDVSDAWLMKNRWHRIAISGAGIFVELLLAAIASLIWWFSEPGVLNSVCMNMMIVCSINTLLFNGNPLLKYDGYYVLADLVQVPNLAARSRSCLLDGIIRLTCGVRFANPRTLPGRGDILLLLYGAASFTYRWFVLVLILWSLHQLLRPIGMLAVAQAITAACLFTYSIAAIRSLRMFLRRFWTLPTNKLRLFGCMVLAFIMITAVWNLPLPRYVSAPITIEPTDAAFVYVAESGRVPRRDAEHPKEGQRVSQGDVLAVLKNPDLEREILKLRERIEVLSLRIESMESNELPNAKANENLPVAKEFLGSLEDQMESFRQRDDRLTIRAPVNGVVLSDEWRHETSIPGRLGRWRGTPLEDSSVGCTLERGTVYCLIGDPACLSATVVVDESDIESVDVGQFARIWVRENPGVVVVGQVQKISAVEIERAPKSLVRKDDVKMIADSSGQERMAAVAFNVRIGLLDSDAAIPIRGTGWAKIEVPASTVGQRIKRYLFSTFRTSP